MPNNNTTRFSNRVDDYVKYRPGYPAEIITYLQKAFDLLPPKTVADIGSGTGISSAMFLSAGYPVYAVEPNQPMREKSIELLGNKETFIAINGTAENTTLPDASINAIVCGQAFHWFDAGKAKKEFTRILLKGGLVVIIWNERETRSVFEKAYDALIAKHATDYVAVDHRNIGPANIADFFAPQTAQLTSYPNQQVFNFEGLTGRLLSSSYMPKAEDRGYIPMINDMKELFDQHQQNGFITIHYITKVYAGVFKSR